MTFGYDHYVPILKAKQGEKKALGAILPGLRKRITPFIEFVERTDKPIQGHIDTVFKGLAEAVLGYGRCFFDLKELECEGTAALELAYERATEEAILFVPVIGLGNDSATSVGLANAENGLSLRLNRVDLERASLSDVVGKFLAKINLEPEGVDLVIDLGSIEDLIVPGVISLTKQFVASIPHVLRWRTLTVSSCAFPKSMGIVDRNSHLLHPRADWVSWVRGQLAQRRTAKRVTTYSDRAIQHPLGVEGFDPTKMQASASIRYATPEDWLLIKGQGTKTLSTTIQFPNLAQKLVSGTLSGSYMGEGHCVGCEGIFKCSHGTKGFGSAGVWRRLGTIHHLTVVANSLVAPNAP